MPESGYVLAGFEALRLILLNFMAAAFQPGRGADRPRAMPRCRPPGSQPRLRGHAGSLHSPR